VPQALAGATLGDIGLTGARIETVRALARAVCVGKINFEGVVDSEVLLNRLREIPGIGKWTAEYVAMRALGEPDAFPSSDLGLLRAMALGSSRDLELRAQGWKPWRAYAAIYLWRIATQCVPGERKLVPLKNQKEAVENTGSHHRVSMVV
jgi:3-methyladenine DNA glycosylase/8-oxoguanine DNA glycosylase